jgi:ribosomal protein S18 acetylase RimI-like enzyme
MSLHDGGKGALALNDMKIRSFAPADAQAVNAVALSAFAQYESVYQGWDALKQGVGAMASLADSGEILVACDDDEVVGAVAYIPPYASPRADFFEPEWPIIRMLVVDPRARGKAIGRGLTEACIALARRDGASVIGLHTSPVMEAALALYLRMGFRLERRVPNRFGVPYAVYLLELCFPRPLNVRFPPIADIQPTSATAPLRMGMTLSPTAPPLVQ